MASYKKIGTVQTVCQILVYLSNQKEPVTGLTVAESLGIPQPTVMTHLATLEAERFVERSGDSYVLGQGAAILHARRKSYLTSELTRLSEQAAVL